MTVVLDASAVVDMLLDLPERPWVLEQIEGEDILAPSHQHAEVLSAIARRVRAGEISRDQATDQLEEFADIDQESVSPSRRDLTDAFALDRRLRVTDALYVVLAADRRIPLITTDRRLRDADPPCAVRCPD